MLRWELGRYYLYCDLRNHKLLLPGTIADNLGVWTGWGLDFVLSTNASIGYIRVFKDGVAVSVFEGVTSKSNGHHVKTGGIYTQHNATNVLNTSTCVQNLKLLNPCVDFLEASCAGAKRASAQDCLACCGSHQQAAKAARAESDFDHFCAAGKSFEND